MQNSLKFSSGSLFALPQPGDFVMISLPDGDFEQPKPGGIPWGAIGLVDNPPKGAVEYFRMVRIYEDKLVSSVYLMLPVVLCLRVPQEWVEPYSPRVKKQGFRLTASGLESAKARGWPVTDLSAGSAEITG